MRRCNTDGASPCVPAAVGGAEDECRDRSSQSSTVCEGIGAGTRGAAGSDQPSGDGAAVSCGAAADYVSTRSRTGGRTGEVSRTGGGAPRTLRNVPMGAGGGDEGR